MKNTLKKVARSDERGVTPRDKTKQTVPMKMEKRRLEIDRDMQHGAVNTPKSQERTNVQSRAGRNARGKTSLGGVQRCLHPLCPSDIFLMGFTTKATWQASRTSASPSLK